MQNSNRRTRSSHGVNALIARFKDERVQTSKAHRSFILVISLVPKGKVASYGQIAKLAGFDGQARQVVWTLHSSARKYKLPWHRIVNSQGKIGHPDLESHLKQKNLLAKEGIDFEVGQKINLALSAWTPAATEIKKILSRLKK